MQVVAEAATGAVQRWIQLNDEATARIMKREEHIEWVRWRPRKGTKKNSCVGNFYGPALRRSQRESERDCEER